MDLYLNLSCTLLCLTLSKGGSLFSYAAKSQHFWL